MKFLWILLPIVASAQSYVPERDNPRVPVKSAARAYAIDLKDVRLLNSPFRDALDRDSGYLLSLSADRLLHRFHENAGLPPKAPVYDGWESEGLSGHTLGHYLSACSMMYAATGATVFADRVAYIVRELARCQDARGTGYVGAIPHEDSIWAQVARGDIHSSGFDLNGGWSPWYTVHKVLSGLEDAYLYTGNREALRVATRLADWTGKELNALNDAQVQHMLACEHGGMNDALANLYAITGNKKYLDLSWKFDHKAILDPLAKGQDPLPGKHSNTQIPKIIGCARRFELSGDARDSAIARNFWNIVVDHHTYVIGGNSDHEYLGEPDRLNDYLSESTCESCNTYNMLKLTRHLFTWNPDGRLGDYYERAIYNHILASQNPEAMMCYFVSLRMGTRKQFSDSLHTFTCCVGSGMENHAKYAEGIYYEAADGGLYVNLFIPSVLRWHGLTVTQTTRFPFGDTVDLRIDGETAAPWALRVRHPWWAAQGVQVLVNGAPWATGDEESGFVVIKRRWKKGDHVQITLPMHLYAEAMPDNHNRVALLYGPVVLAGDLGDKDPSGDLHGVPVLLTQDRNVNDWIENIGPAIFKTKGVGRPHDVVLKPFFETYDNYYSVYWDYFTPQDWTNREVAYEAEQRRQKDIEDRTADVMRLGEMQPERDHHLDSKTSYVGDQEARRSRECRNGGFFAFDLAAGDSLLVTAWGGDNGRVADIYVDGTKIGTIALNHPKPNQFVELGFAIPGTGKQTIRVTFRAPAGKSTGSIFEVRSLRKVMATPNTAEAKSPLKDYPIQPVPFTDVRVDDAFWAPKIEVNREVTIPYVLRMCREHGRINNFIIAARHSGGKLTVYPFDDTDLYKAIEGASYGLQVKKNPELERYLDTLIALIGAAQEPDGYLYTFRSADEARPHEWIGAQRWQNEEILSHELYNCGHLYEAAVAHYQATGKRTLLNIALKNADLLVATFGPGKVVRYPGHQIVEIGLVKLYRVTGEQKYLDLAKFFLDVRGPNGEAYNQADKRIVDQDSAEGHAVRAAYMYTGIADVAALTGYAPYEKAIDRIWTDVVSDKLYITGGIGATNNGEAFGAAYELPNMSAYAETCASIANVYWNSRMFLLHGDAKYIDVLERTLYNGLLSGVSLDGTRFFYPNPLESMGQNERSAWFDCACCITNMARFLPSMPGYVYARTGNTLYINLFVGSDAHIRLDNGIIGLRQETDYPWSGKVDLTLTPDAPIHADLRIRIPGWAVGEPIAGDLYRAVSWPAETPTGQPVTISLNGKPQTYRLEQGYAVLERTWKKGDKVTVDFPMTARKILANNNVAADQGRFALQRGPVVYCLEGPDNRDSLVRNLLADTAATIETRRTKALGGIDQLTLPGVALKAGQPDEKTMLTAIPYYAWANRGPAEMTVWVPYERAAARPQPTPTIASRSKVTASVGSSRALRAINDLCEPDSSNDHKFPYFHWWPRKNSTQWVEYDFAEPRTLSSSAVYWYDDGPWGGCRIPAAWTLEYKNATGAWVPVETTTPYELAKDKYDRVTFKPISTGSLRLVVQLPVDNSAGIHEWTVQ